MFAWCDLVDRLLIFYIRTLPFLLPNLTLLYRSLTMTTRPPKAQSEVLELLENAQARMSMVDGFPYKEEVGGSSPSVPTNDVGQTFLSVFRWNILPAREKRQAGMPVLL